VTYQISWKYDDDELCFAFSETFQGIMLLADTLDDPQVPEDQIEKGMWFDHMLDLIPRSMTQEEGMATIMSVATKCFGPDQLEGVGRMIVAMARAKDQGPRYVN
jgi:hypothetical protein